VQLWSVDSWSLMQAIPVSAKVVSAVAISPDSSLLAIGGADRKIRIWQIRQIAQDAGLV
jgi:WD40 repeat protein